LRKKRKVIFLKVEKELAEVSENEFWVEGAGRGQTHRKGKKVTGTAGSKEIGQKVTWSKAVPQ